MTDTTALLQSILSDPADDLPRLLYADHLDECGESKRAEFIRVQVESSRTDHAQDCRRSKPWKYFGPECTCHVRELDRKSVRLELPERHRVFEGIEFAYAGDLASEFRRGFLYLLHCSWSDWLRHHESLYWHPLQTVECPECGGRHYNECARCDHGYSRGNTGRIPRPFVATAQPITRVELTTWPCEPMTGINASAIGVREHTFNRVKCSACDGRGLVNAANGPIVEGDPIYQCPACRGKLLNEWHCDQWPTITFAMPDSR